MNTTRPTSHANGGAGKNSARSNPAFITGARRAQRSRSSALPQKIARTTTPSGGAASLPVQVGPRPIDPRTIFPSRWANRHPASYLQQDFLDLKRQITAAGGNTVPIKVRPIPFTSTATGSEAFEIVWGHRRHQACFELGLPVHAYIEAVTDEQLVFQMHGENLNRQDLSAFERGRAYDQMLMQGLYPSQVVLAKRLGVDPGDVSRLRFLGTLSPDILAIMKSPLDLAIHDTDKLRPAMVEHGDEVLRRVSEIAQTEGSLPTKQVIRRLCDFAPKEDAASSLDAVRSIEIDGQQFGQIKVGGDRCPHVTLTVAHSPRDVDALDKAIRGFLHKLLVKGKPK
jgi:ParB family transcriptional regulator, chromosome partitioning protein